MTATAETMASTTNAHPVRSSSSTWSGATGTSPTSHAAPTQAATAGRSASAVTAPSSIFSDFQAATGAAPTRDIEPLVSRERRRSSLPIAKMLPGSSISGLRKWTCRVVEIDDDYFSVEINDSEIGHLPVLADFERALLGPTDSSELVVGDTVYLTVRRVRDSLGRESTTSAIRRRRPEKWSSDEVEEIQARAKRQFEEFRNLSE